MTDKVYRIHFSDVLDQDAIQFLDSIKSSRRSEMTRYVIRYYMSFLTNEKPEFLPIHTTPNIQGGKEETLKEYKVRLDTKLDSPLIRLIEQVPRRRRSEFIRHVFHFYLSHLEEGDWILIPKQQAKGTDGISLGKEPKKEESAGELPGDELSGLSW